MKKATAFCLRLGLVLMPFVTLFVCGVVGAWLAKAYHSCLAVFSKIILGYLSFLSIFQIYKYTRWSFGCALSGFFNGLVVRDFKPVLLRLIRRFLG
ncbi:iron transporter [Helicobacter labacensis]|uniref:iron transporter n=1 Tax=Helicobacter labacensis TaxID=2316079 RepID=UPI001F2B6D21|nr:iron transporter [Helicobacter labacensis]